MFKLWLEIKAFFSFVILLLFILLAAFLFIKVLYQDWQFRCKTKYLASIGFERYLHDVASVGGGAWYGWYRKETQDRVLESDLHRIKYKELKKKYK